jgi:tRNA(Arg) A34 adenosine deaminase TadA
MKEADLRLLRASIDVARRARAHGNHPFGALLADAAGAVLLEAENSVVTTRDPTGHAETNLVRLAARRYDAAFLAACTLYASTEPCAMCAGSIVWSGIGRVVFALSEERLIELAGGPGEPTLRLPCREVFARASHSIAVAGPAIEGEAERVHAGFWR